MLIATMYLIRYQSDVPAVPIPAFRSTFRWHHAEPRDMAKLFFEPITDTVCVVAGARRGLEPVAVLRRLPKAQLLPAFLLMSAFATIGGTFKVMNGDNLDGVREQGHVLLRQQRAATARRWSRLLPAPLILTPQACVPPGTGAVP